MNETVTMNRDRWLKLLWERDKLKGDVEFWKRMAETYKGLVESSERIEKIVEKVLSERNRRTQEAILRAVREGPDAA